MYKRQVHTQGVEYTAAALAMRYGEDVERAQVAGLLHDCAKCMENDKLLSACEKHHIPVTDVEPVSYTHLDVYKRQDQLSDL